MISFFNFTFGIDPVPSNGSTDKSVGFGSPDTELIFQYPIGLGLGALITLLLILLAWWSYTRIPGDRWKKSSASVFRACTLVLLFTIALGPMLTQSINHFEQDHVLVLIDRSSSLEVQDAIQQTLDDTADSHPQLISRDQQIRNIIADAGDMWNDLHLEKEIHWLHADAHATLISSNPLLDPETLPKLNGTSTQLSQSIASALDSVSGRPVSGIVLISDGRTFDSIPNELYSRLEQDLIPVFSVPIGSHEPVPDLAIQQIEAPQAAFADDRLPIRVQINTRSIQQELLDTHEIMVELRNRISGELIDSAPLTNFNSNLQPTSHESTTDSKWVQLSTTPHQAGNQEYQLMINTRDGLDPSKSHETLRELGLDFNQSNDTQSFDIQVIDRPMRVLYVDGYPRWEQRYLKNLLTREDSVESSSLVLASNRRFIQDGDHLLGVLPNTIEQWEPFDVIVIGDVRPQLFSDEQLKSLEEHITKNGAGLLWIAGPESTPVDWMTSQLASMLPVRTNSNPSNSLNTWEQPVVLSSTHESQRLGLLALDDEQLGWLDQLSDPSTGWSQVRWALQLEDSALKPGVSVLANAAPISGSEDSMPLVTTMRSGKGRSVFVGTDEIWRWRYARGETLPERFWLPIIRWLGRGTIDRRSASAMLSVSPESPTPGQPTAINLTLFDQSLIESVESQIQVSIENLSDPDDRVFINLQGTEDVRSGVWAPLQTGIYQASVTSAEPQLATISIPINVLDQSNEQRVLDTDHDWLNQLSTQTGGRSVQPQDFNTIPSLLPNRSRTTASPPLERSLWDTPIVLITLVLLLTIEWILRRSLRFA